MTVAQGTRKGEFSAMGFGRERHDTEVVSKGSEEAPAGQQLPTISEETHMYLFGKKAWPWERVAFGCDAGVSAAAVRAVGPAAGEGDAAGEGNNAGARAAAVNATEPAAAVDAVEPIGGDGSAVGKGGVSAELRPAANGGRASSISGGGAVPCVDFQAVVMTPPLRTSGP